MHLSTIRKRELYVEVEQKINQQIEELNSFHENNLAFQKNLKKGYKQILSLLEKRHKLVAKGHYRNMYMARGITLGIPVGVAIGWISLFALSVAVGITAYPSG